MFLLHSLEAGNYIKLSFWGISSSKMICSIISQKNRYFINAIPKTLKFTTVIFLVYNFLTIMMHCTLYLSILHTDEPRDIKTSLGHVFISKQCLQASFLSKTSSLNHPILYYHMHTQLKMTMHWSDSVYVFTFGFLHWSSNLKTSDFTAIGQSRLHITWCPAKDFYLVS